MNVRRIKKLLKADPDNKSVIWMRSKKAFRILSKSGQVSLVYGVWTNYTFNTNHD